MNQHPNTPADPCTTRRAARIAGAILTNWQVPFAAFVGLLFTLSTFRTLLDLERERTHAQFLQYSSRRVAHITDNLHSVLMHLGSVDRLLSNVDGLTFTQFQEIVQPKLETTPLLRSLVWVRVVHDADLPAYEARMRRALPGFRIHSRDDTQGDDLGEQRGPHTVVEFRVPASGSGGLLGFDTSSRPEVAAAQRRACNNAMPEATELFTTSFDTSKARTIAVVTPLYHPRYRHRSQKAPCENVVGYVMATLNADFLDKRDSLVRHRSSLSRIEMEVLVGRPGRQPDVLFNRVIPDSTKGMGGTVARLLGTEETFSATWTFAGQRWEVRIRAPFFSTVGDHLGSLLALGSGLLLTLLACLYLHVLRRRSLRIQQLVQARTSELAKLTEAVASNALLDAERHRLLALFEQSPGFIAVLCGAEHRFSIANRAYYLLVGEHRELLGKSVREALPEVVEQGYAELLDRVFCSGEAHSARGVPMVLENAAGMPETRYVDFVFQPITDDAGQVSGIFIQGTDVSAEQLSLKQLQYLSTHDPDTGLPNRALLISRLEQAQTQADEGGPLPALMTMDFKNWELSSKPANQRLLELLLQVVAQHHENTQGAESVLARIGSNRFALLFPIGAAIEDLGMLAQELVECAHKRVILDESAQYVECGIGIAVAEPGGTATQLLQAAESAMHLACDRGGGRFQFYTASMHLRISQRVEMMRALSLAIERSEFELHYQPQVDLLTGEIHGLEALVRWRHPELGLLGPDHFVTLAEGSDAITQIGEWVLRQACRQAVAWQEAGLGERRIAVNMSARQFSRVDVGDTVAAVLQETGLPPHCLELELTESVVMDNTEHAVQVLDTLKKIGVQIAVDDFGTGYSSLSYLKRFPIDVLKIDRAFIKGIPDDKNDSALSEAIISMAHSLGIRVVAEGVETEDQCRFLGLKMCDAIQGFLFSAPLCASQTQALLESGRMLPAGLRCHHGPARTRPLVDD